nr:MAG TPA: hypothetical protein [Caudoviricetes sp.]DAM48087.1 MAG TPA: hypothetical protein [Caudoviricetes sp.]
MSEKVITNLLRCKFRSVTSSTSLKLLTGLHFVAIIRNEVYEVL